MKKIIEVAIYFLVLILPWQTRWIFKSGMINGQYSEYLSYSLYGFDIVLIGLLFLVLFLYRKEIFEGGRIKTFFAKKIKDHSLVDLVFLALFILLLVGFISADNQQLAAYSLFKFFLSLSFFGVILRFANIVKIAICFVVSLILPAILGITQFLLQTTAANKWLGLAYHDSSAGGTSVIESFSEGFVSGRWLRAYGSFDHPNVFGGALALGLIISLLLFVTRKYNDYQLKFLYLNLIILSMGAFLSFSRSAWASLMIGISFGLGILFFRKKYLQLKKWFFASMIIAMTFLAMYINYHELVNVRLQASARLENLSINQREVYFQQAIKLIGNNKFLGTGMGNYIPSLVKEYPNNPAWTYQPVHNVFFLILTELGILGALCILLISAHLFWNYGRNLSGTLLVALAPMLLLDHWIWSLHFGELFGALILVIAVGFSKLNYEQK